MEKTNVIYFSVNNWFSGRDFPPLPCFKSWLRDDLRLKFRDDKWAKKNKLCIYYGCIDMSTNFTVSAPRDWVEKNCPELLTDDEYTYKEYVYRGNGDTITEEHHKKYSDFVHWPEDGEEIPDSDQFDMPFREYCEENFGAEYYNTHYWDSDDEEEDDYTPED